MKTFTSKIANVSRSCMYTIIMVAFIIAMGMFVVFCICVCYDALSRCFNFDR